jgi:ABC-type glycerol-3-phosphate transport system substrate-binding protein
MKRITIAASACLVAIAALPFASAEGPAPAPKAAATAAAAGSTVVAKASTDDYQVQITVASATPGAEVKGNVAITPKADFKFNKQYPTKIKLTGTDGVTVKQALLKAKDGKVEDKGASFPVGYTCAKTDGGKVSAELKFSVCNAETCKLVKEEVSWNVAAKP